MDHRTRTGWIDGVATTGFNVIGSAIQLTDAPDAGAQVTVTYRPDC